MSKQDNTVKLFDLKTIALEAKSNITVFCVIYANIGLISVTVLAVYANTGVNNH
jgi:putative Ca2+/H+ antiporter (TMEM165/GDT1 family)